MVACGLLFVPFHSQQSDHYHTRRFAKRAAASIDPACLSGGFYLSPKQGDLIDTSQPLSIKWDTSLKCFDSQGVDIYLYAPYTSKAVIHAWGGVAYNDGQFETPLSGSWWNSSVAPQQMQLAFVSSQSPVFTSPVPQGPLFTVQFNTTDFGIKNPTGATGSSVSTSSDASGGGIFQVIGNAYRNSGLPKGSIAAAVLMPILAVAIGIAVYVKFQRAKEAENRKRWSQAVDKRMSTLSTEWKSLPPNTQSEAIRQSIAIMRNSRASMARMSEVYGNDARPMSTASGVNTAGAAGVGVGARKGTGVGLRNPAMGSAQMGDRKSTVSFADTIANRKSTISFATDTRFSRPSMDVPGVPELPKAIPRPSTDNLSRPSTDSRGRASRAFHTAISAAYPEDFDLMSPVQKGGPAMLGDLDVMPALNLMQHDSSEVIFLAQSPLDPSHSPIASPPATHLTPTSATPFTNDTAYSPSYANLTHSPTYPSLPTSSIYESNPPTFPTPVTYPAPASYAAEPESPVVGSNNPFVGFTRGPSNMMSPDAMLKAYARGSTPGLPMATGTSRVSMPPRVSTPTRAASVKGSAGSLKDSFKGVLGRKSSGSLKGGNGGAGAGSPVVQGYSAFDAPAKPEPVGRTLYAPSQPVQNGTGESEYSLGVPEEAEEDAYAGYGTAK
ncbi:hypothetical protein BU17DRAFT_91206 [Hysterangium stoloniferum]|nr:hypothetical protein BU17DRAFT_91206 [Hysterangium stoloniferum]